MKKRLIILICIVLLFSLAIPAHAANVYPKIIDDANLLTPDQILTLETMAADLIDEYDIDVVILTVNSTYGEDVSDYADDYYRRKGYGIGSKDSGVILMLSMEDRDWVVRTFGNGKEAMTKYGIDKLMEENVLPALKQDNFYSGFLSYLENLDIYFDAYKRGDPIDRPVNIPMMIVISLGVGALVGLITILVMKSGMKTAVYQHGARDYITPGSYHVNRHRDIYLYSRTTRVRRSSDSGSSSRSSGGSRGKF